MIHTKENQETYEANFFKITCYYVGGMLIYNTDFCRMLAAEIKTRKVLYYINKKIKNPAKPSFLN
jgi:hypothetical protein